MKAKMMLMMRNASINCFLSHETLVRPSILNELLDPCWSLSVRPTSVNADFLMMVIFALEG